MIAEDNHMAIRQLLINRQKGAAQERLEPQKMEETFGNAHGRQALRPVAFGHLKVGSDKGGEVFKHRVLRAIIEKVSWRDRKLGESRVVLENPHQSLRRLIGQRFEQ